MSYIDELMKLFYLKQAQKGRPSYDLGSYVEDDSPPTVIIQGKRLVTPMEIPSGDSANPLQVQGLDLTQSYPEEGSPDNPMQLDEMDFSPGARDYSQPEGSFMNPQELDDGLDLSHADDNENLTDEDDASMRMKMRKRPRN